jgi:hypothetical protein
MSRFVGKAKQRRLACHLLRDRQHLGSQEGDFPFASSYHREYKQMSIHYHKLTLAEVADDLTETLSDLYVNAGEDHLESLLEKLEGVSIPKKARPSERLILIMEKTLEYEPDQLSAPVQALFAEAVEEICRLATVSKQRS